MTANEHVPAERRVRLILDWASGQPSPCRLAIWVAAAALVHAGAWLAIRGLVPEASRIEPSGAAVYVVDRETPEAEELLEWLSWNSPALFAPDRLDARYFPDPSPPLYHPSYEAFSPELRPLPERGDAVLPPVFVETGPVPGFDAEPARRRPLPQPASETQIRVDAALAGRLDDARLNGAFEARRGDQLEPTEFLVAVDEGGRVLHAICVRSTPYPPLNDAATRAVTSLDFRPAPGAGTAWGKLTIHWGTDVARDPKR